MAKRKFNHIPGKRIKYGLVHPLVGKNVRFDSWMALCEYVLEIAEEEAKNRMQGLLMELICKLSDEIIESAIECEEEDLDEP